jgi:hypothetical protein
MIYLIDPMDQALTVDLTKCKPFCHIKPLYGIII